ENVTFFERSFALHNGQDADLLFVVDPTLTDGCRTCPEELHSRHAIGRDVAIANRSTAVVIHHKTEHLAIANSTALDQWLTAPADQHPGHTVARDLAIFDCSPATIPENHAARSTVVNATAAHSCFGCRPMDRHARKRVGGNITVFQQGLTL